MADNIIRPWNGTPGEWQHISMRMLHNAQRLPAQRWTSERAAMLNASQDAMAAYFVAARAL